MKSLATRFRPQSFEDVCGQKSIIKILERQLSLKQYTNCYLFAGPSGCGKAQPLTSKIYTKFGFKSMGEIKVGDVVLDGNGKETAILGVYPQGERDIYRINLSDDTYIEVSDNHINSVYRNNLDKKEIESIDLTTLELKRILESSDYADRYPLYIKIPQIDCWEDNNIDIDPYLLGCLLGDGSISNKNLAFTSCDSELLLKIDKILKNKFNLRLKYGKQYDYRIVNMQNYIYHFRYKEKDYYSISSLKNKLIAEGYPRFDSDTLIKLSANTAKTVLTHYPELYNAIILVDKNTARYSNVLKKLIKNYKLNVTSDKKFIPNNYIYSSKATRLALLQGLMDTDGTITKPIQSSFSGKAVGGHISITTTSLQLATDIAFLCRSLGYVVKQTTSEKTDYIYRYKGKVEQRKCKQSYTLYITPLAADDIFTLSRKRERICEHRFTPRRKITSVEFVRRDLCQCIYVESSNHQYLTDNLTITHNTTLARIFAHKINEYYDENNKLCYSEPIEIDGASNNGVDNIRSIIESANERSLDSKYKIFLIDEAHMITTAGWNAFLKCIEEPPMYTLFIFCTTNPEKIPATIQNRVMRFNLTRLNSEIIFDRLKYICQQENYSNYEESCEYISKIANGGMRDAIALLEKCSYYSTDLSLNNVLNTLGLISYDEYFKLTDFIFDRNEAEVLKLINSVYTQGYDLKLFITNYFSFILELNKYCLFKDIHSTKLPSTYLEKIKYTTGIEENIKYFNGLLQSILDLLNSIKNNTFMLETISAHLIKLCR